MAASEPADGRGAGAVRPGEIAVDLQHAADAGVYFIGRIRTPYASRADCPRNTLAAQCDATVELDPRYAAGLAGLDGFSHVILLYWMDESRRDLVLQTPRHLDAPRGVFALRSPARPNPIAIAIVELVSIAGTTLHIRNIDCRDGTPLIDIKPYFPSTDSVPGARRP